MPVSSKIRRYLSRTGAISIQLLIVIFFIRFFVVEPGRVNGTSMEPTLTDSNLFLINKLVYLVRPPRRFEIINVINPHNKTLMIKRVIALPGETLAFKHNGVFITPKDGAEYHLAEPYLSQEMVNRPHDPAQYRVTIPENSYFVLGDNRIVSTDSRDYGPISRKFINGRVIPL